MPLSSGQLSAPVTARPSVQRTADRQDVAAARILRTAMGRLRATGVSALCSSRDGAALTMGVARQELKRLLDVP